MVKRRKNKTVSEHVAEQTTNLTKWIGTPYSIIAHTIFFIGIFSLRLVNVPIEQILLILTTAVSLEAIYLAIFIQMTVNKNTESLEAVEDDIEDIQEDVTEIQENVEGLEENTDALQQDVAGLEDNVEGISEDIEEIQAEEEDPALIEATVTLKNIDEQIRNLVAGLSVLKEDLDHLKKKVGPQNP